MTPVVMRFIMHKSGVPFSQSDWSRLPWREAYLLGMMLQEFDGDEE